MWFKNLYLFKLTEPLGVDAETLAQRLGERPFRDCSALELSSLGWVPPLGRETEALVHSVAGCLLITACRQEKLLPRAVVNEQLDEQVADWERSEARKMPRNERARLRDEIETRLLPQALTRKRLIRAFIDTQQRWLVVDAATAKLAEEVATLLRDSLGSLKLVLPEPEISPMELMTRWLANGAPKGWELESDVLMIDPAQERSQVRCRYLDLGGKEIEAHLKSGKRVTQLGMAWAERISILLCDNLQVKRLRYHDVIQEAAEEVEADTEAQRLDADFAILCAEVRPMIASLSELFSLG